MTDHLFGFLLKQFVTFSSNILLFLFLSRYSLKFSLVRTVFSNVVKKTSVKITSHPSPSS